MHFELDVGEETVDSRLSDLSPSFPELVHFCDAAGKLPGRGRLPRRVDEVVNPSGPARPVRHADKVTFAEAKKIHLIFFIRVDVNF